MFFSFGARRPDETLAVQRAIAEMGLVIRSLQPGFNEYVGAGVLAGTSSLYHLRTAAGASPLMAGRYDGPLYSAANRRRRDQAVPVRAVQGRARRRARQPVAADRRAAGGWLPGVRRRTYSGRWRWWRDERARGYLIRPASEADLDAIVSYEIEIAVISFGAEAITDPALHRKRVTGALGKPGEITAGRRRASRRRTSRSAGPGCRPGPTR